MKTETLQLITGIILVAGFIFLQVSNNEALKEDALWLITMALPTFLYASHIVGTKCNRNE
jgi:succinate dehydrogenase/fumarate reductase cytochrome b subunit